MATFNPADILKITANPTLPQALSGLNTPSIEMGPVTTAEGFKYEPLPTPQFNNNAPAVNQNQADDGPIYLENVPVPLSPNNPYLAMFPRKGNGLTATRKLMMAAIDWENKEKIRQQGIDQQNQAKFDADMKQRQIAEIAARSLVAATQNPDVLHNNRSMLDFYSMLLNNPGGELVAPEIFSSVTNMMGRKNQPELSPLDQARLNEINANIRYRDKQTALLGLNDSRNTNNPRLKALNDAYDRYLKSNGAKWNPAANDYKGGWEYPTGFQPLNQVDFIRQSFPNGEKAANEYIKLLTGLEVPEDSVYNESGKKGPSYRPNMDYSADDWNKVRQKYNKQYGGPGKALQALLQPGSTATPQELLILLDSYNQNRGTKYSLAEFKARFVDKKGKSKNWIAEGKTSKKG